MTFLSIIIMSDSNETSLQKQLESLMENTPAEVNYNAKKALVNSIPSVGSLMGHFYETYLQDPLMLRIHSFLENLVQELEELKRQRNTVDFTKQEFLSAFVEARNIALQEHKQEKLEALKNVVLNSAIPNPDDELPSKFLQWIDEFTVRHLVLLKLLARINQFTFQEFSQTLPDLKDNKYLYNLALKDLDAKGLIELKDRYPEMEEEISPEGIQYAKLTPPDISSTGSRRRVTREGIELIA
ncbi:MAG: hypothetical protein ACRCU2_29680, partial [Planktothrix sp.]